MTHGGLAGTHGYQTKVCRIFQRLGLRHTTHFIHLPRRTDQGCLKRPCQSARDRNKRCTGYQTRNDYNYFSALENQRCWWRLAFYSHTTLTTLVAAFRPLAAVAHALQMLSEDVSAGVKSRVHAFEALASMKPAHTSAFKSAPSLLDTPLSPTSGTYFPIAPSPPSSSNKSLSRSPSPSPPILGRKTSLIDLKDWVVEDGPRPYVPRQKKPSSPNGATNCARPLPRHVSDSVVRLPNAQAPPLIQLESPPRNQKTAPPLPPRKSSYTSLRSVSLTNSSTSSLPRSPNLHPSVLPPLPARKKSDSLTVDHAYPPAGKLGITIPSRGNGSGHAQASSISSFHSVSLSSDGGTDLQTPGSLTNFVATYPMDREDHGLEITREPDNISLDESFENVSASSVVSPSVSSVSTDWQEFIRRPEPPKLPQRPGAASSSSSSVTSVPYAIRTAQTKPPPPPPPSRVRPTPASNRSSLTSTTASSDRSSVISQATSRSSISSTAPPFPPKAPPSAVSRPAPIPASARRRYEVVFNENVVAQRRFAAARDRAMSPPPGRKARQAAGWRGLSVDFITNPDENPGQGVAQTSGRIDEEIGAEERLQGAVVAAIWNCSMLERSKLREIW